MRVIELRNPKVLMMPDMIELLKKALSSPAFFSPVDLSAAAGDIFAFITNEDNFFFVGIEDGKFKALMLVSAIVTPMFPNPMIIAVYNDGTKGLLKELKEFALDRLVNLGYTSVLAVNGTGASDEVWRRALMAKGLRITPVGTLHAIEIV